MATKPSPKSGPKGIPAPKVRAKKATEAGGEAAEGGAGEKGNGVVNLRELVSRVVEATGAKKKPAREIVEATLLQLGEALTNGEALQLPGFGRMRVARSVAKEGGAVMTLKARKTPPKKKVAKEALAETPEAV